MSQALDVQNLSFRYRSDFLLRSKEVLKNISFSVEEGECLGFLGQNGAGKTSTIKCILGLCFPSSGSISIHGKDAGNPEARRLLGYLSEQPYTYDHLSVRESMEMAAALGRVPAGEVRNQAIEKNLDQVGLLDRSSQSLKSLSKGLMQRLGLAQALVHNPKLLILDEPFSGLDPLGRRLFRDIFFRLKSEGVSMFISSHALSDIEHLCDRACILVQGEIKREVTLRVQDETSLGGCTYELLLLPPADRSLFDQSVILRDGTAQGGLVQYFCKDRKELQSYLQEALRVGASLDQCQPVQERLEDIFLEVVHMKGAA